MHYSKTHGWVAVIFAMAVFAWTDTAHAQWGRTSNAAPTVTAQQIRQLQADETRKDSFVIVDVRAASESAVSVIPGAITKTQFEKMRHRIKARQLSPIARPADVAPSTPVN